MAEHTYLCIDLKSFYASVECVERGLDPLTTHLVVADESRTDKTICLAVSPSLKAFGIPGRPRLFEVKQQIDRLNRQRKKDPITYLVAPPRMALYLDYSTRIYQVYLKYFAPEDIHVYSIDEVFLDATPYLKTYAMDGKALARKILSEILSACGITATAGIGSNLYLAKVAMDILAKHIPPDKDNARIAALDQYSYRRLLWDHTPITDFWRVGRGYAKKLASVGLTTMGDIARCSLGTSHDYYNEDLLFRLFGVQAELLIDHAWGVEPCTMADIKAYRPRSSCLGSGQVLHCPYSFEKARLILREMAEALSLDLVERRLVTDQLVLTVGYDIENLTDPERCRQYHGEVTVDHYGRKIPKHAHGTISLEEATSSARRLVEALLSLYDRITDPNLLIRRINLSAGHVTEESLLPLPRYTQMDFLHSAEEVARADRNAHIIEEKERSLQKTMLEIKKQYGKNAILKGTNLEEGATAMERNSQIGGHKA